jgi:PAS domain S-box-containing protein
LHASEMSFQVLVESAPIAIFIQTERRFAYANQACLALFGAQTKDQLLGQSVLERFHPDYREQVSARIDQLNEQHKAVNLAEETVVRFDNTTLDTYVSAVPFYFAGKSGALVFVEDITEKKLSTEHAFRLALEQKRQAVLVSFLRDTSHEFRTPLSIIQSDVYLLDRLTDSTKRQQKIEEINQQITNMTRLIELLTESALLDTDMPVDMVALNLNTLISNVVENLRKRNPPDAERVTLALDPALPLIPVDTPRLSMALREIVDNAVRFTLPQGHITVRSALHVEGVMIEVQDDGVGIDPVVRQHLFEWFYRQDHAHTTPGLGLGLAFANAVVKSHGGRIEVESQEGVGSLFRMILPTQDTNVS